MSEQTEHFWKKLRKPEKHMQALYFSLIFLIINIAMSPMTAMPEWLISMVSSVIAEKTPMSFGYSALTL